ncbi:MAG: response regulator [Acidobacteriia bacterium]|nr:response regulator [Terriglobia bacterium]
MTDAIELLLVEDNPSDAELTLHVLKKHKLANRIKLVRDGAEALEFLFGDESGQSGSAGNVPKVILLDLKLPKVNGLEVLGRVKADPRTKNIPVVVLTSSREDRDLFVCYELGVNSYIVKPVDFAQFTEAVHQLGLYWLLFNERPRLQVERAAT